MTPDVNNKTNYIKPFVIVVGILVVAVVGGHYGDSLILGRVPVIKLSPSPLTNTISQSLGANASGTVPAVNKNFSIHSITYFLNNTWAVVYVTPINNDANNAIVVVHKNNGRYTTVLGPGTEFPADSLPQLPTQVLFYLNSQGMVSNESTAD